MGNSSISKEFKSGKWKRIERGINRQVLENIQTNIKVEKHYARSDFDSFDDRFQNTQLYNWRKSLDHRINIVKMHEFEIKEEMFGIQQEEYVYTEKINRFNQKERPYSRAEGFLLIMDFLKGLITLVSVFGYFNIDIFLLGVSQDGKGKVWINENFAKNEIEEKNIIEEPSQSTEMTLVNNLIRLVSDKVYNEDFMPEVTYPWNMNMQQAVDYLKIVRSKHILFQMEKVYLDRNEFKQHFDMLQQRFFSLNQNKNVTFQPIQSNNKNSVQKEGEQNKKKSSEKIQEVTKQKKDPSQTLSSDSNSRSKSNQLLFTANEEPINNQEVKVENQRFAIYNENHQIKQGIPINYERPPIPSVQVPYEPNFQHYSMEKPYFVQQQISYAPEMQRPVTQERPQLYYQPQPSQQIIQRIIQPPKAQMLQGPIRPQYIERKVIKYRTLNQAQIEEQLNKPQSFNKFVQKHNLPPPQFLPFNPNNIESPYFPYHNPISPQKQRSMTPIQQQNRQIIIEEPKQFDYYMMTQSQKLINNVELCESVVLDQNELLSNLRDLEN